MSDNKRHKVLIVDDVVENINILVELLKPDYKTFFAKNGKKTLELAKSIVPDLILLDIVMPDMDGYQVCHKLKTDPITFDIPVIFVSSQSNVEDETRGLELGAVDYITKPISPPIVKARVANHIKHQDAMTELKRLYSMALDANPITQLPGNNSISAHIEKALQQQENVCVIYADLDNFKAYNDMYGFAKGDEVIFYTCQILKEVVSTNNPKEGFVGHIGGDDFVLIVQADKARTVSENIIRKFDHGITSFYTTIDVQAGCIESLNRKGEKRTFPLVSISLAAVDLSHGIYSTYIEVNDACAGTKKGAKAITGSSFFMDRREQR